MTTPAFSFSSILAAVRLRSSASSHSDFQPRQLFPEDVHVDAAAWGTKLAVPSLDLSHTIPLGAPVGIPLLVELSSIVKPCAELDCGDLEPFPRALETKTASSQAPVTLFPSFKSQGHAGDLDCFAYHGVFPQMKK